MDLSLYEIIFGPLISDKAYQLNSRHQRLVLRVHPKANKPLIKKAIEKLFEVKVDKINVSVRKGKKRRSGKQIVTGNTKKIAVVSLKEGHSLDLFKQTRTYAQKP